MPQGLTADEWQQIHAAIRADASPARPATPDAWQQTAKLTASDAFWGDELGNEVAVSGDTVVVGAPMHDVPWGPEDVGQAYVFVRQHGGWGNMTQVARLTASDARGHELLGWTVATDGDTVVAGAPYASTGGSGSQGAAYVFVRPPGGWTDMTQTAKLGASDGQGGDHFGQLVAIGGNTVVAGAPSDNNYAGSVYVFVRPPSGWANMIETARLSASDGIGGGLGQSVGISGDTILAGVEHANAAYVFVRPPGGWVNGTETARLTPRSPGQYNHFGYTVGISGNTAIVGDYSYNEQRGGAYVFVRPPGGWTNMTETALLTASDGVPYDRFGVSVGISHDTAVAGAYRHWVNGTLEQGAAYVFVRPPGGWTNMTETTELTAADGAAHDQFGVGVNISGGTVVIGAWQDDSGKGSAYVFQSHGSSQISGNWDSPETWVGGVAPGSADDVYITAGDTVVLTGDTTARRLLVTTGGSLDLGSYGLQVEDAFADEGTLSQTLPVNNARVDFLSIPNDATHAAQYRGVTIDTAATGTNLGNVTVVVRARDVGYDCLLAQDFVPYAQRCYAILAQAPGAARVRLWAPRDELNGMPPADLTVYRYVPAQGWLPLLTKRVAGDNGGAYVYAEAFAPDLGRFLLGQITTPGSLLLR